METFITTIILLIILGFSVFSCIRRFTSKKSCCGTTITKTKKKKLKNPIGDLTIHIKGMHCNNCHSSVIKKLNALDGVSAKVNLDKGTAKISFERNISDDEIKQAISSAGFEVIKIDR